MEHLLFVGKDKPLQTIQQAIALLETDRYRDTTDQIKIMLSTGRYAILSPLLLARSNLTICAAPAQEVVCTGSLSLETPHWQASAQNPAIYTTQLEKGLAIDGFLVNNQPQILARYPNEQKDVLPLGGVVTVEQLKERAATWNNPSTGYLRALHSKGWGGNDYYILGKDDTTETGLALEWVGDNNRGHALMPSSVLVEGIFEELDAPCEWFYDAESGVLSYYPPAGFDLTAPHQFEVALCAQLFVVKGASPAQPVRNIQFEGITIQNTKRSLFDTKHSNQPYMPLLRGDWAVVASGAITVENAENISITDCTFEHIGGNALFFYGYNKDHTIQRNRFCHLGASGIQLVGKADAVDDPSFWPHAHYPDLQVHATAIKHPAHVGPISEDYPRDITIAENYIYDIGQFEKQSSGINLSIASRIRILHNTIHRSARSNININDGSFGGHEIAHNDIFDAQRETTDHGPFNAWGRDRFWSVPQYNAIGNGGEIIRHYSNDGADFYDTALLDAYQTTEIHHNRFHHEKGAPHSWGIDLDDGSSNYHIYNNLCLGLGIKLREGFARKVHHNIILDGKFEIHVSYAEAGDEIWGNLLVNAQPWNFIAVDETRFAAAEYKVDANWYYSLGASPSFPIWYAASCEKEASTGLCTNEATQTANATNAKPDTHALVGVDPQFADPATNDYTPTNAAAMHQIDFAPFAMDFGAAIAPVQAPIYTLSASGAAQSFTHLWQGAEVCDITDAIISATASAGYKGAYFIRIASKNASAAVLGLRAHDIVTEIDGQIVPTAYDFISKMKDWENSADRAALTLTIHRESATQTLTILP